MKAKLSVRIVSMLGSIVLGWMECVSQVAGQGLLTFGNGAPVYDIDGMTPLSGPGFLAELYAAAPGTSLQPILSSITPFLTGSNAGYFFDVHGDVAIPGTLPGGSASIEVVAWREIDGSTFTEANHPGGHVGTSHVFTVTGLGGQGPGASPDLAGMQSFALYVVPEPSVSWLGCVGLGGLMLRGLLRRRRAHRSPNKS